MRKYLVGALVGAALSFAASLYADVTAPHFTAQTDADVAKCIEVAANGTTVVSFNLVAGEGIDYSSAVCWPEGIK